MLESFLIWFSSDWHWPVPYAEVHMRWLLLLLLMLNAFYYI